MTAKMKTNMRKMIIKGSRSAREREIVLVSIAILSSRPVYCNIEKRAPRMTTLYSRLYMRKACACGSRLMNSVVSRSTSLDESKTSSIHSHAARKSDEMRIQSRTFQPLRK